MPFAGTIGSFRVFASKPMTNVTRRSDIIKKAPHI